MNTRKLLLTSLLAAAAMGVPAWAEDVALTNGGRTTLTRSSGVAGAGKTYTYTAPEEGTTDNGGWLWLGDLGGTANVALGSSESNMALSGSGLVVLGYQGGNGGVVYNFDFTNTNASAFSGKFAVVNQWNNSTVAKLSGTGWSNVEYVFAGVSREQNWVTKRMYNDTSRGYDTLALQGATTLAGITGTSKGYSPAAETDAVAAGIGNINLRESITVATSGTVLTLAGAGTYEFYGKVGTASEKVGIEKTGTGTQVLGGTLYLDGVTVSGGTLDFSGATLSLSSEITNNATVTVSSDTIFVLSDSLKVGDTGNTYSLISGGTINGWNAETLSVANFQISGVVTSLRGASVDVSTDGQVVFTAGAAADLIWNGTSGNSTWNTSKTNTNWKNGSSEDSFYNLDNVTFKTLENVVTTVTLENGADITVGDMTVESGDYTLSTSGSASVSGSTLTVKSGSSLQIGTSSQSTPSVTVDFDSVSVAGTLKFKNAPQTWSLLSLEDGGKLYIIDGPNATANLTINELALTGSSTIASATNKNLYLKKLSGSGDLAITGNDASVWGGNLSVKIDALNDYSGTLSLSNTATNGGLAVSVAAANIGTTAKIDVGAGTTLSITGVGASGAATTVSGAGTIAVVGSVTNFTGDAVQSTVALSDVDSNTTFTGTVELRGVQAIVSGTNASTFGSASKIVLNSAALHFNNAAADFTKDIEVKDGQNGYIRSYANNKIASGLGATISGNVSGAGTLTSSDDGDITFMGTVNIGAYVGNKANGISVFNGDSTTIGTLTVNSGATAKFTGAATEITTANVAGNANFTGSATLGTLNVTNGTTNFTGATNITSATVAGGTLNFKISTLNNAQSFTSATDISVSGGTVWFGEDVATLSLDSFGENIALTVSGSGTAKFAISQGNNKIFSGALKLENGGTYSKYDGGVELAGNVTLGEADSDVVYLLGDWGKLGTNISGALSGAGTAYFGNAGNMDASSTVEKLTISGSDNSYSGEIVVGKKNADTNSGRNTELVLSTATALQNGKVNLAGSAADNYAQLTLGTNAITIAGLSGTEFGKVALGSGVSSSALTVNQASDTTFAGTIADGIALKKTGAGTLTLSGDNAYTGGTVIEAGTVVAAHANALGTTKGVEVKSGATLNLGASAVTVAGLSGAGTVDLASGTDSATLTVNGGGVFTGTLSRVSLVKQGADSMLELSNAMNWISSATVEAGTLRIAPGTFDGYSYVSITSVSVSDGAKLEIAPNLSASVSMGLNATSGVTFAAGASLIVDATGAAENDVLKIITSSVIKFNTGSEDVSLTSDNLDLFVNDFVTLKGWDGLADWSYADNVLSVTLTIPEPSMFGLLAGLGALALAGTRRRRKKA